MSPLIDRIRVITTVFGDRLRRGLPLVEGPLDGDVIFILDGVGGFNFAPVMIRRAIRARALPIGTVVVKWQFGLPGEIWTDLMWLRRNRVIAARLARRLLAFRRVHPTTRIHLFGYSGGGGVAVFVCEALRGRCVIENLILIAPALSPDYNLAPALRSVIRCTVFASENDRYLLGLGTRLFGTIDRQRVVAAGNVGFHLPVAATHEDRARYGKVSQVRWSQSFRQWCVSGGHIGWLSEPFVASVLLPLITDGEIPSGFALTRETFPPSEHPTATPESAP